MKSRPCISIRYDTWKPIIWYACLFCGCNFKDDIEAVCNGDVFPNLARHTYGKHDDKTTFPAGTTYRNYRNRTNSFPTSQRNGRDSVVDSRSSVRNRYAPSTSTSVPRSIFFLSDQLPRNADRGHLSMGNIAHSTHRRPYAMSEEGFEKGCQICDEEDAYKRHEAVQCLGCKKFVCGPCYENIKKNSDESRSHDYGNGIPPFQYHTQFKCPYCRKPYE